MKNQLSEIVSQFLSSALFRIVPLKGGHIHDSWIVSTDDGEKYILQKINMQIFKDPVTLMENIQNVCNYLKENFPGDKNLVLVPTIERKAYFVSYDSIVWRMFEYIEHEENIYKKKDLSIYYEAGKITGKFNLQLAFLPSNHVKTLLQDFHNTPKRYQDLMKRVDQLPIHRLKPIEPEISWLSQHRQNLDIIWNALTELMIPWRITHNDTKLENILFNKESGEGICLIDLDTVMPGNLLFDFGDAIRSMTNSGSEDEANIDKIEFLFDVFESYTYGFITSALPILNESEISLLAHAPLIITIEQGIRFLIDYIDGDKYYKIDYPDQNLVRFRTQIKLAQEMELYFDRMKNTVNRIVRNSLAG